MNFREKTKRIFSTITASALLTCAIPVITSDAAANSADPGYLFYDSFESDSDGWTGRGAAKVASSSYAAYEGSSSLSVDGRTASWNGASKKLDETTFIAGEEYSFSVNAMYDVGGASDEFKLTLQFTDASGKVDYSEIAKAEAAPGEWVQLANTNYQIPEGATDLLFYVETIDSEISFYIDEAVAASAGRVIKGAGKLKQVVKGDLDFDGVIDGFDTVLMRRALIKGGFDTGNKLKAADVNGDKKLDIADLVLHQQYIMGKINEWPEPPKPDNKWDDYQETASADWINFYKNSIHSMGNTYRLVSKLEAAESGKPLTVGYLGGSITEGKNYSSPFSGYVKQTFAKGSFKEVNAGMSGTSSVVGLVRSDNALFQYNPDIIFIEFSVNDHEDIMYKKCFDSLVKKCLSQPNEPAVIILINRSKGGFSSQSQMSAIGKSYNVPIISMDDALTKAFNSGFLKPDDYFTDEYHPHAKGGQLVADCLAYFFRQAMRTENRSDSYTIPTKTAYGSEYADCSNADVNQLTNFNSGSFTKSSGYGTLPYGYVHQKGSNTPMTFKTTGKGLIIVFKANSSGMGSINVTVNGKTTKVNGSKQYTWGGPDAELGYYQDTSGELNVSISMDNPSSDFTIWGIGLIK